MYPLTIFIIFLMIAFTIAAASGYAGITEKNKSKEVFDYGIEVQAKIDTFIHAGSVRGGRIVLRYKYIDEDGYKYEGPCYIFKVSQLEKAKLFLR